MAKYRIKEHLSNYTVNGVMASVKFYSVQERTLWVFWTTLNREYSNPILFYDLEEVIEYVAKL